MKATTEKKTVVMIAYSFPPEGNAGSYRPLRYVRNLGAMGWCAKVISADKASYERYDPALLDSVPEETEIIRVRSRDPWELLQAKRKRRINNKPSLHSADHSWQINTAQASPIRSLARQCVRKLEAWCYHPDQAMPWIWPATQAALKLYDRERPDVTWATAGPVSSFFVAEKIFRRTGVPYVLDFRDAKTITFNPFADRRPAWAQRSLWKKMHRLLRHARAVVFLYDSMAECFWQAYPGALHSSRIHIIPNGYEGDIEISSPPKGDRCTVLYGGTLMSYSYGSLLEALKQLKSSDSEDAKRLRLVFVGEGMESLSKEANRLDLNDIVEVAPPVTYDEIVRKQRESHALLLLGRPRTMRGYELFAGAKLFGYLKSGRPILGLVPEDETRKILQNVGVSTIADPDSPAEIITVLKRLVKAWSENRLASLVPDPASCESYSAGRQTEALVRALEGTVSAQPFVPGSIAVPNSLRPRIAERQAFNRIERKVRKTEFSM
jgi:hypothetical protein